MSLCVLLCLLWPAGAAAQTELKLATLVPEGSVWHQILADQITESQRATAQRVRVRLYPGGVAGDEPDIVRKMRIGQFNSALLTTQGLLEIDPAFKVFTIPMFYRSLEEVRFVLERLSPMLEERLAERNFVLINWGYAGWVHVYSRRPVTSLAELQAQRMFLWGGEEASTRAWRARGLQPVGMASTDIMVSLQTGLIDALATTPLASLSLQWYRLAPHHLEDGISPLIGATIVTRQAWQSLSEADRAALLAAGRRASARYWQEVPAREREAITAMSGRGLTVTRIAPAARAVWDENGAAFAASYRGAIVPADVYDMARRARDEFRASRAGTP